MDSKPKLPGGTGKAFGGERSRGLPRVNAEDLLSLSEAPPKAAASAHDGDPYNTSGSFDRTKHWARVGKR